MDQALLPVAFLALNSTTVIMLICRYVAQEEQFLDKKAAFLLAIQIMNMIIMIIIQTLLGGFHLHFFLKKEKFSFCSYEVCSIAKQ